MHRQVDGMLGQMRANEKLALMSHNMHLCRRLTRSSAPTPPLARGGKNRSAAGSMARGALSGGSLFSVDADRTRPRLAAVSYAVKTIREKAGTLNALLGEIGDCFVLTDRRNGLARAVVD